MRQAPSVPAAGDPLLPADRQGAREQGWIPLGAGMSARRGQRLAHAEHTARAAPGLLEARAVLQTVNSDRV